MYRIYLEKINDIWFAVACSNKEHIIASAFSCSGKSEVITEIVGNIPTYSSFCKEKPKGNTLDLLKDMYYIYRGKSVDLKFKLDMSGLSSFAKKVFFLTSKIPRGYVATYGGIAKALRNSSAARAVGRAESSNPFTLIIPCHRVVGSDLKLHGYKGGLDVKRAILRREGIPFKGKLVSKQSLWLPRMNKF